MILFNFISGLLILVLTITIISTENVQTGVDLVTNLSNSIIPPVLKGLARDNENIVVGPFGLLSNLAIILEASDGKTREEILRSLKISEEQVNDLEIGFKAYCELFLEHASAQEAAGSFNSAAISTSFQLGTTYKNTIGKNYCANISESNSQEDDVIEIRSDAGVMSHWRDYEKLAVYTFLSHQSVMPFSKENGDIVSVPMIPQVGVFKNVRWEKSQIILLPLQAKFVHLLLVIPDEIRHYNSLVTKLVNFNLPHLIESMPKSEIEVFIPQMTAVNKNLNVSDILMKSGIRQVFDSKRANLTKASDASNHIYLKNITQNAYFSTSFVALNSVSGTSTFFGKFDAGVATNSTKLRRKRRDTKKFYIDRPFLFFLLHKNTQLVLLTGKIGNPAQLTNYLVLLQAQAIYLMYITLLLCNFVTST